MLYKRWRKVGWGVVHLARLLYACMHLFIHSLGNCRSIHSTPAPAEELQRRKDINLCSQGVYSLVKRQIWKWNSTVREERSPNNSFTVVILTWNLEDRQACVRQPDMGRNGFLGGLFRTCKGPHVQPALLVPNNSHAHLGFGKGMAHGHIRSVASHCQCKYTPGHISTLP